MRYDKGALGALMDEYERALNEYITLVSGLEVETYNAVLDPKTEDNDCRSIRAISNHVLWCGYGYANAVREAFGISQNPPNEFVPDHSQIQAALIAMITYTDLSLQNLYRLPFQEVATTPIPDHYILEVLMEHAIVHILRHRRQIERLTSRAQ